MIHLILSPAKNLNEKTALPFDIPTQLPPFLEQSHTIMQSLVQLNFEELQSLMNVSEKIAKLNVERNRSWELPFDNRAKPAIYLFDGDAYKGLNAYELNKNEIEYISKHLSLLSGLYGLINPLDRILPYRLEMGTKLAVGNARDLYQFWGDMLTDKLTQILEQTQCDTLVNVASNEYFGAINPKKLKTRIVTPKFLDYKNGEYKMISFYAKRARGLMVRFCAVNNLKNINELKEFDMEGYFFDKTTSDDTTWVFKREPLEQH